MPSRLELLPGWLYVVEQWRSAPPIHQKGIMNRTITRLSGDLRHWWAGLGAVFAVPEPEPADYPFVPSDVAQLHRLTANAATRSLDDQSWSDLLLERYLDELSREASIFGRQELYRRLRGGLSGPDRDAQAGRVRALMDDPAGLEAMRGPAGGAGFFAGHRGPGGARGALARGAPGRAAPAVVAGS
jgi:hypothetical protein